MFPTIKNTFSCNCLCAALVVPVVAEVVGSDDDDDDDNDDPTRGLPPRQNSMAVWYHWEMLRNVDRRVTSYTKMTTCASLAFMVEMLIKCL